MSRFGLLSLLAVVVLSGCGGFAVPTRLDGNLPAKGSIVPNTTLQLMPSLGISLEKVVYWGAYAGIAYLVVDPLAPNWSIEETRLADNTVHLALKMKRFHMGGDGEARVVFRRRAKYLAQFGSFKAYQVLEYSESMESSVFGGQRLAEGVIHLTRKDDTSITGDISATQGNAPPARNISDKATNPRS